MALLGILPLVLLVLLARVSAEYQFDDVDAYSSSGEQEDGNYSNESSDLNEDFHVWNRPSSGASNFKKRESTTVSRLPAVKKDARQSQIGDANSAELENLLQHWYQLQQRGSKNIDKEKPRGNVKGKQEPSKLREKDKEMKSDAKREPTKQHPSQKAKEKPAFQVQGSKMKPNKANAKKRIDKYGEREAEVEEESSKANGSREVIKITGERGKNKRKIASRRSNAEQAMSPGKNDFPRDKVVLKQIQHEGHTVNKLLTLQEKPRNVLRGRVVVNWKEESERSIITRLKSQLLSLCEQIRQVIANFEPIAWGSVNSANETREIVKKQAVLNVVIEQPKIWTRNESSGEQKSREDEAKGFLGRPLAGGEDKIVQQRNSTKQNLHESVDDLPSLDSEEEAKRDEAERERDRKDRKDRKDIAKSSDERSSPGLADRPRQEPRNGRREKLLQELRKLYELSKNSSQDRTRADVEEKLQDPRKRHRQAQQAVKSKIDELARKNPQPMTTIDQLIHAVNDVLPDDKTNHQNKHLGSLIVDKPSSDRSPHGK